MREVALTKQNRHGKTAANIFTANTGRLERKADTAVHRGNVAIADRFRDYADLLNEQGDDGFRSGAYQRAAAVVAALDQPIEDIYSNLGRKGLMALPGVGKAIGAAIVEIVTTGRWSQLDRLRGELPPTKLFRSIPGLGKRLSQRLAEDEHFESLEDLEYAVHFGHLSVKGIGPRRKRMIAAALAERLGAFALPRGAQAVPAPSVSVLLRVDRIYRESAVKGELPRIAPKRFNPQKEAWLPILHMRQSDWHFTALYSNTRLAHELGKTRDWVVIYHQREGQPEGRSVVVTETRRPNTGKRVVRGRESGTCSTSIRSPPAA